MYFYTFVFDVYIRLSARLLEEEKFVATLKSKFVPLTTPDDVLQHVPFILAETDHRFISFLGYILLFLKIIDQVRNTISGLC